MRPASRKRDGTAYMLFWLAWMVAFAGIVTLVTGEVPIAVFLIAVGVTMTTVLLRYTRP